MSTERWALIANPVAGKGKGRRWAAEVARQLTLRGVDLTLRWTDGRGHGEELTCEAVSQGVTRVVACGGDGTVHEVVNGLVRSGAAQQGVALGLVPLGRCNDLTRALTVPLHRSKVVDALLSGSPRPMDLGRVGDRYFTTVATLGFDSAVTQYIEEGPMPSFLRGTAAYLYGIFVNLIRYRDVWVSVKGDFGQYEGRVFLVATGNTHTYAGRIKITPSAVPDDGWLDVCLVREAPRLEVLRMLPRSFSGSHVTHRLVSLERTRVLEIRSHEPLTIWADGERVGRTPASIEVVPGALQVLAP